jgi:hypothetical protein
VRKERSGRDLNPRYGGTGDVAEEFFERVLSQARARKLLSDEHFSVDGTLVEAWASHKSFRPKDGGAAGGSGSEPGRNTEVDFHGQKRRNDTHESTTDPGAKALQEVEGIGS